MQEKLAKILRWILAGLGILIGFLLGGRSRVRRSGSTGGLVSDPRNGIDAARSELGNHRSTDDSFANAVDETRNGATDVANEIDRANDENRDILKRVRERGKAAKNDSNG